MTKHFTLLLFIGLAFGQNPCDNKQYIALGKKGYQNLNDDEFDIYMDLHEKCKNFKSGKVKKKSTKPDVKIFGTWLDDSPYSGGVYVIKKVDGSFLKEITFNWFHLPFPRAEN